MPICRREGRRETGRTFLPSPPGPRADARVGRGAALAGSLLAVALLLGCSHVVNSEEADEREIRSAVETYLRQEKGMNPADMNMEIQWLEIAGPTATARIRFSSPKAARSLIFEYDLHRSGEGWTVSGGHGSHDPGPGRR